MKRRDADWGRNRGCDKFGVRAIQEIGIRSGSGGRTSAKKRGIVMLGKVRGAERHSDSPWRVGNQLAGTDRKGRGRLETNPRFRTVSSGVEYVVRAWEGCVFCWERQSY